MGRKNFGVTVIELLIVLTTVGLLAVLLFFAFKTQMAKARDGRRRADLAKIQKALEDYMNDVGCYPNPEEITFDNKICGQNFSPYLNQLPCDPINNEFYNFFYSYDNQQSCKSWYKIYAKLEYEKDSIIEKVGCLGGCGPSKNYNYLVSSPNMMEVAQISPGEDWWPEIGGTTIHPPPLICSAGRYYGCVNGACNYLGDSPPSCWPYYCESDCGNNCLYIPPPSPGVTANPIPVNECIPY